MHNEIFMIILRDICMFGNSYLLNGIEFGCFVTFCTSAAIYFLHVAFHKKDWHLMIKDCLFSFCMAVYGYMVIGITLLSRQEGSTDILNYHLFSTFSSSFSSKLFIAENVILFVPFGILLVWFFHCLRHWYYCMGIGFIYSLFIEVTQRITGRGKFEADDIMTNAIGMMVGYGLGSLLCCIGKRIKQVRCSSGYKQKRSCQH